MIPPFPLWYLASPSRCTHRVTVGVPNGTGKCVKLGICTLFTNSNFLDITCYDSTKTTLGPCVPESMYSQSHFGSSRSNHRRLHCTNVHGLALINHYDNVIGLSRVGFLDDPPGGYLALTNTNNDNKLYRTFLYPILYLTRLIL